MSFAITALLPWVLLGASLALTPLLERALAPWLFTVGIPCMTTVVVIATAASVAAVAAVGLTAHSVAANILGATLLAVVSWRVVIVTRHAWRVLKNYRAARPFARATASGTDVLVIDDPVPDAFASPVGPGVVVITTGMRDVLRSDEISALIRHERAHLRYRHAVWIQLCELCAQLNPMMVSTVRAVRHAAERHADEVAATDNRPALLRAIARASLARTYARRSPNASDLHGGGGDVVRRIQALSDPSPTTRSKRGVVVAASIALAALVVSAALGDVVQDCAAPEKGEPPTAVFR